MTMRSERPDAWQHYLDRAAAAAEAAGAAILPYFKTQLEVIRKEDKSPVTMADLAAHRAIAATLGNDLPLISEEDDANKQDALPARYWLVDPLDGTKSFLRGEETFCVCVALMDRGRPVVGAIHIPVTGWSFGGIADEGAWQWHRDAPARVAIHTRQSPPTGPDILLSHSHHDAKTEAWLQQVNVQRRSSMPSAIKFTEVAKGAWDVYPRFGPTMEWDTAAGQAILEGAGGRLTGPDGEDFIYGKPGFRNGPFIAWGS